MIVYDETQFQGEYSLIYSISLTELLMEEFRTAHKKMFGGNKNNNLDEAGKDQMDQGNRQVVFKFIRTAKGK